LKEQFATMNVSTHTPKIDHFSDAIAKKLWGTEKVHEWLYTKSKEWS